MAGGTLGDEGESPSRRVVVRLAPGGGPRQIGLTGPFSISSLLLHGLVQCHPMILSVGPVLGCGGRGDDGGLQMDRRFAKRCQAVTYINLYMK